MLCTKISGPPRYTKVLGCLPCRTLATVTTTEAEYWKASASARAAVQLGNVRRHGLLIAASKQHVSDIWPYACCFYSTCALYLVCLLLKLLN